MSTKAYDVGLIESGVSLPRRMQAMLTPAQQRALELEDGDSFLLQTIPIAEGKGVSPKWRSHNASHIAARLANWARVRHIRLAYRLVGKDTVRIWRLGVI